MTEIKFAGSMAAGPDDYQVIADIESLRALQPAWDALSLRTAGQRFSQSHAWCLTSWDAVEAPHQRRLHCIVARNAGRLVLVWPFTIRRQSGVRLAQPLGTTYAEYATVLVEDGPEAEARIALAWRMLRKTCAADVILLRCVPAGSSLHRLMAAAPDAVVIERFPTRSVSWDGGGDWDDYLRSLKGDQRREIRRRRRLLEQAGRLAFEAVDDAGRCAGLIDWTLGRKIEQLAGSGRRGHWLETREYRDLLTGAAARGGPAGRVVVFALRLDDRVIATAMTRVDRCRIEMMNTVFDGAFAKFGPGQILIEDSLKWACGRGLDFDFRIVDQPYKRFWANRAGEALVYHVANSLWGTLNRRRDGRTGTLSRMVPPAWRQRLKTLIGEA